MKRDRRHPCLVVGYDGSPASRAAIEWAARRAGQAGKVVVVYAFGPPPEWLGRPGYQEMLDVHRGRGQELLDELGVQEGNVLTAVDHEVELLAGRPAEAIVRVAETWDADEIVVGSRGFGRVRGALGSVSHELVHLAERPLVIIPERSAQAPGGKATSI